MLITRPILQRLSPSIREAAPQSTDGVVQVPSLFSFVGLPPEPTQVQALAGSVNQSSLVVQLVQQVANAIQSTQSVMTLGPGWWKVKFTGSYRSNYVLATNSGGDWRLILTIDGSSNVILFNRFATALIPTQDAIAEWEFLVRGSAAFSSVLDANGAAQEHTIAGTFMGSKLL
jgi:hypothetical protein